MDEVKEILSGTVRAVVYQNGENGYSVLRIETDELGQVIVVGTIPDCAPGELIEAEGFWMHHPQHGRQFKAELVERALPSTEHAILSYLASGIVKGIGPATAARIVERFGAAALDIIEQQPERLMEIKGLTKSKAQQIGESFRLKAGVRRLMEFLAENSLPPHLALRLYRFYGDTAITVLKNNPYILADAGFEVGFSLADSMALTLGHSAESALRVSAGVLFELRHNLNNGHSFLPRKKLAEATAALLDVSAELAGKGIGELESRGEVIVEEIAGETACYLYEYYEAEVYVGRRIRDMAAGTRPEPQDIEELIDITQREHGIEYARFQREAVRTAAEKQLLILTGGPGTGKTTSVRGILSLFQRMNLDTVLAAPTGRAAKRLTELTGAEAFTIHRLLEAGIDRESGEMHFGKGEADPLNAEAVIVDECSMIDLPLMRSLLSAMKPDCRLVMVGDANQLPSVGAGNVFSDIIRSGIAATVKLTEIFRQALESDIVVNAHKINSGEAPDLSKKDRDFFFLRRREGEKLVETVVELCLKRLPQNMGIAPNQIQVLAPMRKGRAGTLNLNRELQNALNPPAEGKKEKKIRDFVFREGDRVMQIKNNYDIMWRDTATGASGSGVFNGDIGIISEIDDGGVVSVLFDERRVEFEEEMLSELEPAFAMTVHKAQGSEYRAVVLSALDVPGMLCYRGVLYTAVTRARELFIIVGDDEIISRMTENNRQRRRYSGLRARLVM